MDRRKHWIVTGALALTTLAGVAALAGTGATPAPGSHGVMAGFVGQDVRIYLRSGASSGLVTRDGRLDSIFETSTQGSIDSKVRVVGADTGGVLVVDVGSEFFSKNATAYIPYSSIAAIRIAD